MVTLPSYSTCASMGQSAADAAANINAGVDQPVAVLWSGRETNPSSIVVRDLKLKLKSLNIIFFFIDLS